MSTKKLTHLAMLITFALVIHIVESFIPTPVPGAKLGLANVITLMTFVLYGINSALFVSAIRTVLGSFFAGSFLAIGFYLSFFGAMISTFVMAIGIYLWRKGRISLIAVSIMGAVAHNTTQVVLAAYLLHSTQLITFYLPFLLIIALPTGFFTGLVVTYSQKALANIFSDIRK